MANISEGQLLRTQSTTGMAPSMDQNHSQNVNERIMRQLSDLQAKYTESQMALADAMKQKQGLLTLHNVYSKLFNYIIPKKRADLGIFNKNIRKNFSWLTFGI